jgi:tRNA A-37 threonylcarbamoyl transferase component Bud32
MTPSLLLGGGWFRGLLAALSALARAGSGRRWCAPFVTFNPAYAGQFRAAGLERAEDFLALPETIISGHPDRQVSRVQVGVGPTAFPAILKKEHRVPWKERLLSAATGFGPASKSVREALTLQELPAAAATVPEWIAAGEAADGRAFLLLRELSGAVELRRYLDSHRDAPPVWRHRFRRRLAGALARLHALGFAHGDLYANHVLVVPETEEISFVDWQRSFRRGAPSLRQRWADLAALSATLAPDLAGPCDRLAFLRSYLEQSGLPGGKARLLRALANIRDIERGMIRRRHVRAKRLPPLAPGTQSLICLDGEALNVTAAYLALWPDAPPEWLSRPDLGGEGERKVLLPDGSCGLLKCRRRSGLAHGSISPERAEMGLLFRLQRHGIEAPQVLAVGDRRLDDGAVVSFLLSRAPESAGCKPAATAEAGAFLARLHAAGCYFRGTPRLVLERVDGLVVRRRWRGYWKWRDLRRLFRELSSSRSRADWNALLAGYRDGWG